MKHAVRLLILASGLVAGVVAGMGLAFALSPLWPLAILMVVALPVGWYFSHRPWHGPRRTQTISRSWRSLFGPPITRSGKDFLVGLGIGTPTGLYFFGRIVWST